MLQAQRNKYLETTIQTATPAQLLVMLYDGAIRFCKLGVEAIKQSQYEVANVQLLKAQDIISEFMITLDREAPVSEGLYKLYEYFIYRLREANMQKSTAPVEEVMGYLMELKETWIQAAKASTAATAGAKHG
jgi:flagellar secretion chaperone FliS